MCCLCELDLWHITVKSFWRTDRITTYVSSTLTLTFINLVHRPIVKFGSQIAIFENIDLVTIVLYIHTCYMAYMLWGSAYKKYTHKLYVLQKRPCE